MLTNSTETSAGARASSYTPTVCNYTSTQMHNTSTAAISLSTELRKQSLRVCLLVTLTKWVSRTCLLLQYAFLESCRTPKKTKTSLLVPHMLIPWRDSKPATTRSAQRKEDQLQQLPSYLQRLLTKNLKIPQTWIPPCWIPPHPLPLKDPSPFFPSTPKLLIQAFIFHYKTLAAQIITPPSSSFLLFGGSNYLNPSAKDQNQEQKTLWSE